MTVSEDNLAHKHALVGAIYQPFLIEIHNRIPAILAEDFKQWKRGDDRPRGAHLQAPTRQLSLEGAVWFESLGYGNGLKASWVRERFGRRKSFEPQSRRLESAALESIVIP